MNIRQITLLMRPEQWVKNLFVGAAMFFSGNLTNLDMWGSEIACFVAFCLASSAVYCFNDIADAKRDRLHPLKCKRPVASGCISRSTAGSMAALLSVAGIGITALACDGGNRLVCIAIIAGYLALNLCYTLWLKRVAIIDVTIVAIGFDLRVWLGAEAADIWLSPWIVTMVFLLALTLALGKRRYDALVLDDSSGRHYSVTFLTQSITMLCAATLVCYVLFCVSPEVTARFHTDALYLTSLPVMAGLLRYMQLTFIDNRSGDPTRILLDDKVMWGCVGCWIACFIAIIYL